MRAHSGLLEPDAGRLARPVLRGPSTREGRWATRLPIGIDDAKGDVHHAAMVAGNIDGDIRYTQHMSDQVDASLTDRRAIDGSTDKVYVMRVNPDW
jgi:hypothetical protein